MESKSSSVLDLTRGEAPNGSYALPGSCGNCGWSGTLTIRKGEPRPTSSQLSHRDTSVTCPNCGCKTVSARV